MLRTFHWDVIQSDLSISNIGNYWTDSRNTLDLLNSKRAYDCRVSGAQKLNPPSSQFEQWQSSKHVFCLRLLCGLAQVLKDTALTLADTCRSLNSVLFLSCPCATQSKSVRFRCYFSLLYFTTCFGLTGHNQVHKAWLRNLPSSWCIRRFEMFHSCYVTPCLCV